MELNRGSKERGERKMSEESRFKSVGELCEGANKGNVEGPTL